VVIPESRLPALASPVRPQEAGFGRSCLKKKSKNLSLFRLVAIFFGYVSSRYNLRKMINKLVYIHKVEVLKHEVLSPEQYVHR